MKKEQTITIKVSTLVITFSFLVLMGIIYLGISPPFYIGHEEDSYIVLRVLEDAGFNRESNIHLSLADPSTCGNSFYKTKFRGANLENRFVWANGVVCGDLNGNHYIEYTEKSKL